MTRSETRVHERGLGLALALTSASLVVQPFVAAATTTPFSWARDAISDLAVTSCGAPPEAAGTQSVVCSPWWPLMGAGIVVGGLAMLAAGLLLRRTSLGSPAVVVLLVVAGLSTTGVGLVPLDVSRPLHLALAAPLFPAQNLAVLLLGLRLTGPWRAAAIGAGLVGLVGSLAVVAPLGVPFGVAERVGAYPAVVVLTALGVAVLLRGLPAVLRARTTLDR